MVHAGVRMLMTVRRGCWWWPEYFHDAVSTGVRCFHGVFASNRHRFYSDGKWRCVCVAMCLCCGHQSVVLCVHVNSYSHACWYTCVCLHVPAVRHEIFMSVCLTLYFWLYVVQFCLSTVNCILCFIHLFHVAEASDNVHVWIMIMACKCMYSITHTVCFSHYC